MPQTIPLRTGVNVDGAPKRELYLMAEMTDLPTCPVELTRAALRSLAASAGLDPCAHYRITDYNRANVGSAKILLHAVDESTLSKTAMIQTAYDNIAWDGEYDIDTNRITRLHDNLGNKVSGRYGTEVDRFDWGNVNHYEVEIHNADVYVDRGTAYRIRNTEYKTDASVDYRGATGYTYNSKFGENSITEADSAVNFIVNESKVSTGARIYAERSTNSYVQYSELKTRAQWYVRDQSDNRLYYQTLSDNSYTRNYGADRMWLYQGNQNSNSIIRAYSGDVRLYYTNMDSYSEWRNEAGAGALLVYYGDFSSRSYNRNYNTNSVRLYSCSSDTRAAYEFRDAADLRGYFTSIRGYARLRSQGTATVFYTQDLSSQVVVTFTGGTHYRGAFSAYARPIFTGNTRQVYGHGSWAGTYGANSSKGRDYFNNTLV